MTYSKEIIEAYLSVVRDDLKDGEKWCEIAIHLKDHDMTEHADFFYNKAYKRLHTDFVTDWEHVQKCMMTAKSVETCDTPCWEILHDQYSSWHKEIVRKLNSYVIA